MGYAKLVEYVHGNELMTAAKGKEAQLQKLLDKLKPHHIISLKFHTQTHELPYAGGMMGYGPSAGSVVTGHKVIIEAYMPDLNEPSPPMDWEEPMAINFADELKKGKITALTPKEATAVAVQLLTEAKVLSVEGGKAGISGVKDISAELQKMGQAEAVTKAVQNMVAMHPSVVEAKKLIEFYSECQKYLSSVASKDFPPDDEVTFHGDNGSVVFSPCKKMTTVVDLEAKKKIMTMIKQKTSYDALATMVKLPIEDVKKTLTEAEVTGLLVTQPGARTLKAVVQEDSNANEAL